MSTNQAPQTSPFGMFVDQMSGERTPIEHKGPSKVVKSGKVCPGKSKPFAPPHASTHVSEELALKLVPRNKIKECFGLKWSKMTFWRREQEGAFVPPVRIGRDVYYRYGEVLAWIAAQEADGRAA